MRLTAQEFRDWDHKAITLLGMSGVGKTRLSGVLGGHDWFHYTADYRIGSHYLDEHILDNIKQQMMDIPFLRSMLRSNAIRIRNNISTTNLTPVSSFLGKLGDPDQGGLALSEFKRRQQLYYEAEMAAMRDVPHFITRAREMYQFRHFVNDASGSLCELGDPEIMEILAAHSVIVYIKATAEDEKLLIDNAVSNPKPLYYREEFLDEHLARYMTEKGLEYAALIEPDDFVRWIFPHLFYARVPRYEAIAEQYGYALPARDVLAVNSEADFLALMDKVLER